MFPSNQDGSLSLMEACLKDPHAPTCLFESILACYDYESKPRLFDVPVVWAAGAKETADRVDYQELSNNMSLALEQRKIPVAVQIIKKFPSLFMFWEANLAADGQLPFGVVVKIIMKDESACKSSQDALDLADFLLKSGLIDFRTLSPLYEHRQAKSTALGLTLEALGQLSPVKKAQRAAIEELLAKYKHSLMKVGDFDCSIFSSKSSISSSEKKSICDWIIKQRDLCELAWYSELLEKNLKQAYQKDDFFFLEAILRIRPAAKTLDIMDYLLSCESQLPTQSSIFALVKNGARIRKGLNDFKANDPAIALVFKQLQKSFELSDIKLAMAIL